MTTRYRSAATPGRAPLVWLFGWLLMSPAIALQTESETTCLLITGLGGMPEYEENFLRWAEKTEKICAEKPNSRTYRIDGRQQRKKDILTAFQEITRSATGGELWFFLIGHASHDQQQYKFNIRGPDLTDGEIKNFLDSLKDSRIYLIAATSASGPLAEGLEGPNRVILTATKSSTQKQPPLFMSFFLEAVIDGEADLDKNDRVSILEAFSFSRHKVSAWFEEKGRLQTEHALLADNGETRLGRDNETDAAVQPGSLLASTAYLSGPATADYSSPEAQQLEAQRIALEREIEDLRFRKSQMSEQEYYASLEVLLLKLARLNETMEGLESTP